MAAEQGGEVLTGPQTRKAIEGGKTDQTAKAREAAGGDVQARREALRAGMEEADLTPEQKKIMEKLRAAKNSEERVKIFATIADDVGLDSLVSLIPELGDAGSSTVSGIYLLMEAKKAGLGTGAYLKIIGLQGADLAVGAIPILGDAADYFFKANKWSGKSFETQTKELIKKAREAGVPEDKVNQLLTGAEKWPQMANKAVGLYAKRKQAKAAEAEPVITQSTGA